MAYYSLRKEIQGSRKKTDANKVNATLCLTLHHMKSKYQKMSRRKREEGVEILKLLRKEKLKRRMLMENRAKKF